MPSIEVRPVRSARDRATFIKLPWPIYADDPYWVPPLIADMKHFIHPRKGVFFAHGDAELFIAYRDGKAVGRISAQISHRHHELYRDGKGFFGFFECSDDQEAANALFTAAESYLAAKGCTCVEGPYSFTIYDEIGILVDGFDSTPYVMNMHHRPYYGPLIEGTGYAKAVDWYAFRITEEGATHRLPDRIKRLRDRVIARHGVSLRTMDPDHFDRDTTAVKAIFDSAWSPNYGHVPMTDEEFRRIAAALKRLIIPEISFVAEVDGKPAGFILSAYDANLIVRQINGRLFPFGFIRLLRDIKKLRRFRVLLMGVLDAYQGRGYELVLYTAVMERGLELGLTEAEVSNVVETNKPMMQVASYLPAERYKTYRIYSKPLAGAR